MGLADLETGDKDSGSSSGWITSLLQDLSPMEGTSSSSSTKGGGIYVGDSLPPTYQCGYICMDQALHSSHELNFWCICVVYAWPLPGSGLNVIEHCTACG